MWPQPPSGLYLFVVVHEEPALAPKFGVSYQQYRSSVHRWLIRKPKSNAIRGAGFVAQRVNNDIHRSARNAFVAYFQCRSDAR